MINVFALFYVVFLLGCFISSIFVIYHITKYSINKSSSNTMLVIFVSGLAILLIINFSIFQSIDMETLVDFGSNLNNSKNSF